MPLAAGFVGILPALGLLNEEQDGMPPVNLSWIAAIGWSCSVAFFGYACCLRYSVYSNNVSDLISLQRIFVAAYTQTSGMCRNGTRE